ncbi:MAG TPA: hypothetical protein PKY12_01560 [Catalimonadaceae bacterium]|nr:hypothetical protein [Catalimonadaceae bacterium]
MRKLGSDQGFEINGKKFKKRFTLSNLKSVLGPPDTVNYYKKVKGRYRSFGKGIVGCTFDKPAYVDVFYNRFGVWCTGPTDKSLLLFSIDLSKLNESSKKNILFLFNSDTIHLEYPILDTSKINALPFIDEFLLSSVLVDSSAITVQNLIRSESFYSYFEGKKKFINSRDRFMLIDFDHSFRCMGLELNFDNIGYNFR